MDTASSVPQHVPPWQVGVGDVIVTDRGEGTVKERFVKGGIRGPVTLSGVLTAGGSFTRTYGPSDKVELIRDAVDAAFAPHVAAIPEMFVGRGAA